jgi:hypothetical protein
VAELKDEDEGEGAAAAAAPSAVGEAGAGESGATGEPVEPDFFCLRAFIMPQNSR